MSLPASLRRPGRAWALLAAGLAVLAVVGWCGDGGDGGWFPRQSIDWQPALFPTEPWRAFSAIGVHYSLLHLAANLAGAAAVGALGVAARVPAAAALAWLLAWPLTQIGLLAEPALVHYGGLSGVLHAGVAAVAWHLLRHPARRRERVVGALLLVGLVVKVALEAPWGPPMRPSATWGIATAPLAHATGLVAGLVCAAIALRPRAHRASNDSSNANHV